MVDQYVSSVTPVGSKVLIERYGFTVSPATIRGDLHALEEDCLLRRPHTSAGRLPTDGGYRRVVDDFLAHPDLLGAGPLYPDESLAGKLGMSVLTSGARGNSSTFPFPTAYTPSGNLDELLRRTSAALSAYANCLAIAVAPTPLSARVTRLCYTGLAELFAQPEFSEPQRYFRLMRVLDDETELNDLLMDSFCEGEVTVRIGHEMLDAGLDALSIVLCPYRTNTDTRRGVVAVVGPTRMDYRRAIPAVTTAAWTLSEILR
ncbi:MAG: DeoR family transcriptional regulator [Actinomycetes bacterium]|nr:DeoR family transcriptional regulator [Actinomycetes bacterium]